MRIGEVLSIKISDFDLTKFPARIKIPYSMTKTKRSRLVFISTEAKDLIEKWLVIRVDYLQVIANRMRRWS